MEGDTVKILTQAKEENGDVVYSTEISGKPKFMLDEEYYATLISCAIQAVTSVCHKVYPENRKAFIECAKGIMNRVIS